VRGADGSPVVRTGEGGQHDDFLVDVCRVPALAGTLGGDRGQCAQAREEQLRVSRDRRP
jgi:hypothetical protein